MSYGRVKIYSDAKEITIDNVVDEVGKAFALHSKNRIDTENYGDIIGKIPIFRIRKYILFRISKEDV